MPIINTENKMIHIKIPACPAGRPNPNTTKSQINPKSQITNCGRRKTIGIGLLFAVWGLSLIILSGCVPESGLEKARRYNRQSRAYYERSAGIYKDLIGKGQDVETAHFELGKLYYRHGDFRRVIRELKGSPVPAAGKFLGISYYLAGDFTDALDVFNKINFSDDESSYFYGLTCEKLNLFDQALVVYKKITGREFAPRAAERVNLIERQINLANIKDKDPATSEIIVNAPPAAKYPQAGALILFCDEKFEITASNTEVSDLHYVIKILNDRGKQDFSESQIEYDSTYEKVELEYARTIKPDGQIVDVGTRHIRDVSKYLNFPLYSNVRVHIISFPEITEGAVVEYKLKVYRSQLINKKDFVLDYPVQTKEPVLRADFSVTLPGGRALKVKTLNDTYNTFHANLTPSIQQEGGRTVYRWQFKDIPQIIPEPNMPPNVEINPTLLLVTFENWQDIYNWWWALAKDKIKADAAIIKKVKELLRDRPGEEDRVRAIYNFCAQEIRYVAVEYGQAGYEPHYAADIFKNKYGDCKDQAILLVTMLKEAGFTAWPVLIPTKECYNLNPDFPSMLFNHCIAAVSLAGKMIFLDPTAQTCSFGDLPPVDQRRRVAVFKEDGYLIQETPLYEAAHNLIKQALSININPDETIAAEKSVFSHGVYDQAQRYWLLFTPPELIEQTLAERIQEVSIGAKLKNYNIANLNNLNQPVVLSYAFQGPEYLTMGGDLRILPQLADVDSSLVAKEKRNFAIDFGFLDAKETATEIQIPANFTVRYLPENIDENNQWLKFKAVYSHKGNKIIFRQDAELKQTAIAVGEYADFKNFFAGLAKKVKQRIILEKVK